jgi:hypothetical protein
VVTRFASFAAHHPRRHSCSAFSSSSRLTQTHRRKPVASQILKQTIRSRFKLHRRRNPVEKQQPRQRQLPRRAIRHRRLPPQPRQLSVQARLVNSTEPAPVRRARFRANRVQFRAKYSKSIPSKPLFQTWIMDADKLVIFRRKQPKKKFETFSLSKDNNLPQCRSQATFQQQYCIVPSVVNIPVLQQKRRRSAAPGPLAFFDKVALSSGRNS